jgi:hypothetical protein
MYSENASGVPLQGEIKLKLGKLIAFIRKVKQNSKLEVFFSAL